MATIIAGRFEQQSQANDALGALVDAGFSATQVSVFYVNPAGQHDQTAIGGDRDKSPGAEDSEEGTAGGLAAGGAIGAAIGAAAIPIAGPLGPLTGAAVGAHIGQLAGTLGKMKEDGSEGDENPVPRRRAGMLVAVSLPGPGNEQEAVRVLRGLGAEDIERSEGNIVEGDWQDFDPTRPLSLLDGQSEPRGMISPGAG